MLGSSARTASTLILRAVSYLGLFLAVVLSHLAVSSALRAQGQSAFVAQLGSGAAVLAAVLSVAGVADWARARHAAARERRRLRLKLPDGPCCVLWDDAKSAEMAAALPWRAPVQPRHPRLARSLGVEGATIVEFEVGAKGGAENMRMIEAWPSYAFYNAARRALARHRFRLKRGASAAAGERWRVSFVFRIAGNSRRARVRRARRV